MSLPVCSAAACLEPQGPFCCSDCEAVAYCSRAHQKEDWPSHKDQCQRLLIATASSSPPDPAGSNDSSNSAAFQDSHEAEPFQSRNSTIDELNAGMCTVTLSAPSTGVCGTGSKSNPIPFIHRHDSSPFLSELSNEGEDLDIQQQVKRNTVQWLSQMCKFVVRDLQKYGICVVDNFMGRERAEAIHRSVVAMYHSGVFVEGETVTPGEKAREVRSDKIAWVVGTEDKCTEIAKLISTVGAVIMNAAAMKDNGELGQRNIDGRSRAMVACYPGSGAHYVKHVDNPNRDGRAITTTYYLNKDWDAKNVGGLLRIFPQGWANKVVDIEPLMDRLVLFWSDRRNPHEVQPAYRTRYAITIWYFDRKERDEALRRKKIECAPRTTGTTSNPNVNHVDSG